MSGDILFVFGVLAVAIILFASGRVRLDVVALLVLFALMLGGVVTVGEALAGFSEPVVLMIAGLFIIGEGLVTTGIAFAIGDWLMRVGGTNEPRLVCLLMVTVGLAGAFISSTGIVAIFVPIVLTIAAKTGLARSRLMMPVAFAALISGMMTLISTPPNLVVNAELRQQGLEPFGFFDFTPIGLVVLAVGVGYMLVGRQLLGGSSAERADIPRGQTLSQLTEAFGVGDKIRRLRIKPGSPLIGQSVGDLELRTRFGVTIISIEKRRGRRTAIKPALSRSAFQSGDIIGVVGESTESMAKFIASQALLELPLELRHRVDFVKEMGLAEVMLAPDSKLIGKTLREAAFRSRHHVNVVAIRRKTKPLEAALASERLKFGDTLLVSGRWRDISALQADKKDFVVLSLPLEIDDVAPAHRQAPWALGILVVMIASMAFGWVPNVASVLLAAMAMVATRCVTMDGAYKVIHWPSLVLIAGMLPLATALQKTGGTNLIVDGLVAAIGDLGPMAMMAGLFVLTAILGLFISNTATALLLAPIAIGIANDMGVAPYAFVMTVAIAASAAFMSPVSSPVNTLVLDPGGYTFMDFAKVGVPLTVLVMFITLPLIPVLFPF